MNCQRCKTGLMVEEAAVDMITSRSAMMHRCIMCGMMVDAEVIRNRSVNRELDDSGKGKRAYRANTWSVPQTINPVHLLLNQEASHEQQPITTTPQDPHTQSTSEKTIGRRRSAV